MLRRAAAQLPRRRIAPPLLRGCGGSVRMSTQLRARTYASKVSAAHTERMSEATAAWSDRWTQLVEWEQAADTAATQSRIAHWGKKRLRAEGHMMVRGNALSRPPLH